MSRSEVGREAPPARLTELIRNHSGPGRRRAGTTTCATGGGRRRGRRRVARRWSRPAGPARTPSVARGPLTFPLAAPCAARGPHTPARGVRKRKSKDETRLTTHGPGRLDCRFTTHLVDRHKTACRITHALNKQQPTSHIPHCTRRVHAHQLATRTPQVTMCTTRVLAQIFSHREELSQASDLALSGRVVTGV